MNTQAFISLFQEKRYVPELFGKSKDEILLELLNPLKENHVVNNVNMLFETLKKRETLGSTGIGKSIAVPHCRTLTVSELVIVIGHSSEGKEWDAIDNKPVHLFFLIIAPPQEKQNNYLPVLGKICEMVRENKVRKNLLKSTDFREFVRIIEDAS